MFNEWSYCDIHCRLQDSFSQQLINTWLLWSWVNWIIVALNLTHQGKIRNSMNIMTSILYQFGSMARIHVMEWWIEDAIVCIDRTLIFIHDAHEEQCFSISCSNPTMYSGIVQNFLPHNLLWWLVFKPIWVFRNRQPPVASGQKGNLCYDSNNPPAYRGCPVRLRPMAVVFYVRWHPMSDGILWARWTSLFFS